MNGIAGPTAHESLVEHGPDALKKLIASEKAEAEASLPELQLAHDEANERHQAAILELRTFRAARATLQRALESSGEKVSRLIEIEEERLAAVSKVAGGFLEKARQALAAGQRRLAEVFSAERQFPKMRFPDAGRRD